MMASWLTPSCLFVFINLVIGAIAITFRFANTTKKQHQRQLVHSPSLLQRFTSFNFHYHKHETTTATTTLHNVVDSVQSLNLSKLDRDKSFNLSFNKKEIEEKPDPGHEMNSSQLDQVPSTSLLDRIRSFNHSFNKLEIERPNLVQTDSSHMNPVCTLSLMDRVRSFNLQRLKSLTFERSESINKSMPESEAEIMGGGEEEEGEVDAKADDFINRFRQQLRLQRLDSVLRYRDMLKRN